MFDHSSAQIGISKPLMGGAGYRDAVRTSGVASPKFRRGQNFIGFSRVHAGFGKGDGLTKGVGAKLQPLEAKWVWGQSPQLPRIFRVFARKILILAMLFCQEVVLTAPACIVDRFTL